MKLCMCVFAVLLLAASLCAQEEGGGGLPSSLFGATDFGSRGPQANPMDAVKKFFAQSNITFSGDQEKAIKPIVENAFKEVQGTVERLSGQPAADGERRGGGVEGGQRRGRGGANLANNPQLAAELQKINDEVLPKIVAVLKPDQQAAFKNWQNAEIKKGGGFAALKLTMEQAGAPLTSAQEPQIRALYVEDSKQRLQLQRAGQGTADPAKLSELEKATLANVVKLLTPEQRKALLDSRTKQ
jgi:hypothetical protein